MKIVVPCPLCKEDISVKVDILLEGIGTANVVNGTKIQEVIDDYDIDWTDHDGCMALYDNEDELYRRKCLTTKRIFDVFDKLIVSEASK